MDDSIAVLYRSRCVLSQGGNRDLLRLNQPLQLVVMKRDPDRQVRRYVGENAVEWRKVLRTGVLSMSVELGGGPAVWPAHLCPVERRFVP